MQWHALIKTFWDVESPIEIVNNIFIAYACRPHNCDITNFMIIYDFTNDKMFVGIRENEKAKTYAENGATISRCGKRAQANHEAQCSF